MRPTNHKYLFQIQHLINISLVKKLKIYPTPKLNKSDLRATQQLWPYEQFINAENNMKQKKFELCLCQYLTKQYLRHPTHSSYHVTYHDILLN